MPSGTPPGGAEIDAQQILYLMDDDRRFPRELSANLLQE